METPTTAGGLELENTLEEDTGTEVEESDDAELDLDGVLRLIEGEVCRVATGAFIRQEVVVRVYESWTDIACAGRVPLQTCAWIAVTAQRICARECNRSRALGLECCVQMPATDTENTISTERSRSELLERLLPRLTPRLTPLQRLVLAKFRSCPTLDDVCDQTGQREVDLDKTLLLIGKKARRFLDNG